MSSPTTSPPAHPNGPLVDISTTYGAILIGIMFSAGLLGIAISQTWTYRNNFPKDRAFLKIIVIYVVVTEALRLGFAVHGIYYYLVAQWGNPFALPTLIWTSQMFLFMSSVTEVSVRLYFCYRVYIISRHNKYITAILVSLSLAHFGDGVATWVVSEFGVIWVVADKSNSISTHTELLGRLGKASLSLALVADWSISLSLIFFLKRGQSGMANTNSIINRIVFYTVNMGLITSCMDISILALTFWVTKTQHLYSIALYQVVGNLYANSILASLNSRIALRNTPNTNVALSDFSTFAIRSGQSHSATVSVPDMSKGPVQTDPTISFSTDNFNTAKREDAFESNNYPV